MALNTPVAFFIFNRPQQTARVFRRIAQARPPQLLVIADGSRGEGESQRVDDARAVLRNIDWPCELRLNLSESNLGCRKRISSGLDWVFHHVERAIILEDDCVPDPSFFSFCEELLERYSNEPRVSMISGDNFQFGRARGAHSYYFSRIAHIWGWATWRRAWQHYDVEMRRWPEMRRGPWLANVLGHESVAEFYRNLFDRTYLHMLDSWDAQWAFASLLQDGLSIIPQTNLVTNIGFGFDATHTRVESARESNMTAEPIEFPLNHPDSIERDIAADEFTFKHGFGVDVHARRSEAA